jgi:hypothetical protein
MVPKIRVSKQGLTRCPTCASHIKLADDIRETVCPFCADNLVVSLHRGTAVTDLLSSVSQSLMSGRGGLITASLVGASLALSCSDAPAPNPADTSQVDTTTAPDTNNAPEYGLPPDSGIAPDTEPAPDTNNAPEYGLPPDSGIAPDTEPAPDTK